MGIIRAIVLLVGAWERDYHIAQLPLGSVRNLTPMKHCNKIPLLRPLLCFDYYVCCSKTVIQSTLDDKLIIVDP